MLFSLEFLKIRQDRATTWRHRSVESRGGKKREFGLIGHPFGILFFVQKNPIRLECSNFADVPILCPADFRDFVDSGAVNAKPGSPDNFNARFE